jgi:hypothetical protein
VKEGLRLSLLANGAALTEAVYSLGAVFASDCKKPHVLTIFV